MAHDVRLAAELMLATLVWLRDHNNLDPEVMAEVRASIGVGQSAGLQPGVITVDGNALAVDFDAKGGAR